MGNMFRYLTNFLTVFFGLSIIPASAHEPYYTQTEALAGPNKQTVAIKLLHGDGIFYADPIRAVIVDAEGKLLAASPMSTTLFIACNHANDHRDCIAYDELRRLIYKPNWSLWKATSSLEMSGQPQAYPDYRMEEYGFDKRKASLFEVVKYEALSIIASPMLTVVAVIWWIAIGLLITPLYWRLKRNKWRIEKISFTSFSLTTVRLISALALVLIAAYGWLLFPYSLFYLIVVVLIGAALALILTKPKKIA